MISTGIEPAHLLAWLLATPAGRWEELSRGTPLDLANGASQVELGRAAALLEGWRRKGLRFLPLGSSAYPRRLLRCPSPPPFLFLRGELPADDLRAVAIVGTRSCSEEGRRRAYRLARELARSGICVISGLALGIDSAAHLGALSVPGGRTVAVIGTGPDTIYPAENRELQARICRCGGVLSQFMPGHQESRGGANFLLRNRTMADLAMVTVVVEASLRSGARSQAVYALKRGGPVLLLRSLVRTQSWAAEMAEKPGCFTVAELSDVLRHVPPA